MTLRSLFLYCALILACGTAKAARLTRLEDGSRVDSQALLAKGEILVAVENDCLPCTFMINRIKKCPAALQQRVDYVSVDSAGKAKKLLTEVPGRPVYLGRPKDLGLEGTPTTLIGKEKILGLLKCEDLERK